MTAPPPSGYDDGFLGALTAVPNPADGRVVRELTYVHFTVLLDPARRLAVATGVNIDGAQLRELDRSDDWRLDPRVDADEQAGADVYAANDLDRGHLVRRSDPVWGAPEVAEQANSDTFVYPNAAPQAAQFNQSMELWLGLEDYLLTHADTYDTKLSVFTAPVLAANDPPYRGVGIPPAWGPVTDGIGYTPPPRSGFRADASTCSAPGPLDGTSSGPLSSRIRLGSGHWRSTAMPDRCCRCDRPQSPDGQRPGARSAARHGPAG